MRVRATATGSSRSNAIGQLELSCTKSGLALGLYGVGAYSEGYGVGALTTGTRVTVPYSGIKAVRVAGDEVFLHLQSPGFPHDKLTLTRFTAGPGVPPVELRRRRLILHFTALSIAALASLSATILAPLSSGDVIAWGALGYGAIAASLVLALGYALDQNLLLRPPGEDATREAFLGDLALHFPNILRNDLPLHQKKRLALPRFTTLFPRTAATVGMTMAAAILTALVSGQRLFMTKVGPPSPEVRQTPAGNLGVDSPQDSLIAPEPPAPITQPQVPSSAPESPQEIQEARSDEEEAVIERRCLCDRADSQLWKKPIPRLSALLIEKRSIPLKNYIRSRIQVAVVNNGDTAINEITLNVQFFERRGKKRVPTKDRPLYFEGPLRPGEAIKWTTEARGTEFEINVPQVGYLGTNGDGAASAETFYKLLEANHRPVRLHAARILSYLGDERARKAALDLKDAMRAAEAPYLRRILAATGDTRICDVELKKEPTTTIGVCVYNGGDAEVAALGVQLNALSGNLDIDHPLADPPSLRGHQKWRIPGKLNGQSGRYVRIPLPEGFLSENGSSLEVTADLYELLD